MGESLSLSKEKILETLDKWSDVGVLIFDLTHKRTQRNYPAGTLKFVYDKKTDIIYIQGLSNQHLNYVGKLEDLLKEYDIVA